MMKKQQSLLLHVNVVSVCVCTQMRMCRRHEIKHTSRLSQSDLLFYKCATQVLI